VNNTNDSGGGSLREAIELANANGVEDVITFSLPELDPGIISVESPLPALTEGGTAINGDFRDGPGPDIMLLWSKLSTGWVSGLIIESNCNVITGLAIAEFTHHGIRIDYGDGNRIEGCYIGTDLTGAPCGNGSVLPYHNYTMGISLLGANQNTVTGNVVCAQTALIAAVGVYVGPGSDSNEVTSNWIGTNQAGDPGLGNDGDGLKIHNSSNNTVDGNVLSGNSRQGVYVQGAGAPADGNQISNNLIGLTPGGDTALPNGFAFDLTGGIWLTAASYNTVTGNVVCAQTHAAPEPGQTAAGVGVLLGAGSQSNTVTGNWLGTNQAGDPGLGNDDDGLKIFNSSSNVVTDNVLSGNGRWGVFVQGVDPNNVASGNQIVDNSIGIATRDGTALLPNAEGVRLSGSAQEGTDVWLNRICGNSLRGIIVEDPYDVVIGANEASGNGLAGVVIKGQSYGVTVTACSIYDNGGLGIDLGDDGVTDNDLGDVDDGPNGLLNFPEFTTRGVVGDTATFDGIAPAGSTVEVFTAAPDPSGHGEGKTYRTSATADGLGNFSCSLPVEHLPVTATATDGAGNTSEFSWVPALHLIPVAIDIKPGSDPNAINNDGHGVIPVAVLGSEDLDVSLIKADTVWLQGMAVKAVGKADKLLYQFEDVNADGFDDMVLQIQDADGAFAEGATTATLTAEMWTAYSYIRGQDSIVIVPPGG
jgi:parallel beta-helix repeat protein